MDNKLFSLLACRAKQIDDYLRCYFHSENEPQKRLFDAMNYSLLSGGKRLRPVLCMEFCVLCGARAETALDFAAAVEMVHTYSLIHDDLPAMDNDDYRRGRLTNHKVYGEAEAILAGDGLLTEAFGALCSSQLPPERIVKAVGILSECAGAYGMVGGQSLDIASEQRPLNEQEVLEIQTRKTGRLISAACRLGVTAAGGTDAQQSAAARYADQLGLAFQIQDDILDACGDAAILGKAVGVDGKKNTFVRLYGIETCRELVEHYTNQAVAALTMFGERAQTLCQLAYALCKREC